MAAQGVWRVGNSTTLVLLPNDRSRRLPVTERNCQPSAGRCVCAAQGSLGHHRSCSGNRGVTRAVAGEPSVQPDSAQAEGRSPIGESWADSLRAAHRGAGLSACAGLEPRWTVTERSQPPIPAEVAAGAGERIRRACAARNPRPKANCCLRFHKIVVSAPRAPQSAAPRTCMHTPTRAFPESESPAVPVRRRTMRNRVLIWGEMLNPAYQRK